MSYSASGLPPGLSLGVVNAGGLGDEVASINGTLAPGVGSAYTVTITASDGTDSSSISFYWIVTTTVTLFNPGDQASRDGSDVNLALQAVTTLDHPISYAASNLPPGLSLDPVTGVISGTIPVGSANTYPVSIFASDSTNEFEVFFNWTVLPSVNIVNPGDQLGEDGDSVNLALQGTSALGLPLTYSASNLPEGLSIDPLTGLISGTIAAGAASDSDGTAAVTVVADDGFDTSAISFSWFLVSTVSLPNPGNQTTAEGFRRQPGLASHERAGTAGFYSVFNLPPGLSVDPDTGVISGTIAAGAAANSPYIVSVLAQDNVDLWETGFLGW